MAYCDKCGAYIPDGQTVCLACGFDPAKEAAAAQSAAYDGRQAQEQERIRRQEEYRRQAQEERERRAKEEERRRKQEEYRRQAQEEQARRNRASSYAGHPYSAQGQANRSWGQNGANTKLFSILSYISVLFILPFIFCPNDKFARFHAKQGLILFLFGVVADLFTKFFGLGILLSIFRIVCMVKGIVNAANGREEPLPYIGRLGGDGT